MAFTSKIGEAGKQERGKIVKNKFFKQLLFVDYTEAELNKYNRYMLLKFVIQWALLNVIIWLL